VSAQRHPRFSAACSPNSSKRLFIPESFGNNPNKKKAQEKGDNVQALNSHSG
jgi:hypothetical protein